MKFTVDSLNYCATVVEITNLVPVRGLDNLVKTLIFHNAVLVSKDTKIGDIGIFFPLESALSEKFLGANNLFRKPELGNVNPEAKGFFEYHGRVRAVKFKSVPSEGFYVPISTLETLGFKASDFVLGDMFNTIDGIDICKKYDNKKKVATEKKATKSKTPRFTDIIAVGQFRFHYDTGQFKRNLDKFNDLDTVISVSDKWHGTSVVISHVRTARQLTWYEKLIGKLGVQIAKYQYAVVAASRKVIKSVDDITKGYENHYYKEDIWTLVKNEVKSQIPKGFTIYGEIVGYVPSGGCIQKGYSYGCSVGEHKLMVYRVTFTNEDGEVTELYWKQMLAFCDRYNLTPVVEYFYGTIREYLSNKGHIVENLLDNEVSEVLLTELSSFYLEKPCPFNDSKVPAEGVVVRIDTLQQSEAFKLKSFSFLKHETEELDSGEVDMETMES